MPVSIDEVTAEVEPPLRSESSNDRRGKVEVSPEAERRKLEENLSRIEARAARIFAD